MIIDGKNIDGKRVSASLDNTLWALFVIHSGSLSAARKAVRHQMSISKYATSANIRVFCLLKVARPSLVAKYWDLAEAQMDIEEV